MVPVELDRCISNFPIHKGRDIAGGDLSECTFHAWPPRTKFRQDFRLDRIVEGHEYFVLIGADVTGPIHTNR